MPVPLLVTWLFEMRITPLLLAVSPPCVLFEAIQPRIFKSALTAFSEKKPWFAFPVDWELKTVAWTFGSITRPEPPLFWKRQLSNTAFTDPPTPGRTTAPLSKFFLITVLVT